MSNSTATNAIAGGIKSFVFVALYALTTFALAAIIVANLPEKYHFAVLAAWVASLYIGPRVIRG